MNADQIHERDDNRHLDAMFADPVSRHDPDQIAEERRQPQRQSFDRFAVELVEKELTRAHDSISAGQDIDHAELATGMAVDHYPLLMRALDCYRKTFRSAA